MRSVAGGALPPGLMGQGIIPFAAVVDAEGPTKTPRDYAKRCMEVLDARFDDQGDHADHMGSTSHSGERRVRNGGEGRGISNAR